MKKWYITPSTNILIDTEKDTAKKVGDHMVYSSNCYIAPCDCTVFFSSSKGDKQIDVKEGQIVFTFYRDTLPHQIVVFDSTGWKENIQFTIEENQKIKEEWAANSCCDCESKCAD